MAATRPPAGPRYYMEGSYGPRGGHECTRHELASDQYLELAAELADLHRLWATCPEEQDDCAREAEEIRGQLNALAWPGGV